MRTISLKRLDSEALNHGYVLVPVEEYTGLLISESEANYYRDFHRQDAIGERLLTHAAKLKLVGT